MKLDYIDRGQGRVILFAHGLGSSLKQWEKQIDHFSKSFRVIALTFQGHGDSDKPREEENYSIKAYREAALGVIKNLDISDIIWVGNSMGGVIGLDIRVNNPGIITLLITNGTTPELRMSNTLLKFTRFMDKLLIKLMKWEGYIKFASKNSSKDESVQSEIFKIMKDTIPEAVISSHQSLGNYGYLNSMEGTDCKLFIIKAEYDNGINSYLKKYNRTISNKSIEIVEIREAGHIANMDRPDEYNKILTSIITPG